MFACNSFSSYSGATYDVIKNLSITGNTIDAYNAAYAGSGGPGIAAASATTLGGGSNVGITGNTIARANKVSPSTTAGAITIAGMEGIVVSSNLIQDCGGSGIRIGGNGATSTKDILVTGNNITKIQGTSTPSGVTICGCTTAITKGEFNSNYIADADFSYRFETPCVDVIVSDDPDQKTTISGFYAASGVQLTRNGMVSYTPGDQHPSVYKGRYLSLTNASATVITRLDDGTMGQVVTLGCNDSNTTLREVANGGSFETVNNTNFICTPRDLISFVRDYNGRWYEVSRSVNP